MSVRHSEYINRGPSRAPALEDALAPLSAIPLLPTRRAHSPKVLLVKAVTHIPYRTCPHLSPYTQSVPTLVWLVAARRPRDQAPGRTVSATPGPARPHEPWLFICWCGKQDTAGR